MTTNLWKNKSQQSSTQVLKDKQQNMTVEMFLYRVDN